MIRCPECQATHDCLCRCRNRIRLVAKEIDAMGVVIEEARPVATASSMLAAALAAYDAAVAAREAAP